MAAFAVFGGIHGIEAPSSNIQAPEKHQAPSTNPPATRLPWDLVLGYSLDVGAWCLVLRSAISLKTGRNPAKSRPGWRRHGICFPVWNRSNSQIHDSFLDAPVVD